MIRQPIVTENESLYLVLRAKNETIDGLTALLSTMRADMEKCRAVIASVEWAGRRWIGDATHAVCVRCDGVHPSHKPNCALEAAKGTR